MTMFFIIDGEKPIYEFNSIVPKEEFKTLMCVHSSLDTVDYLLQSQKRECYLGVVNSEDPLIVSYSTVTSTYYLIQDLRYVLVLQIARKQFNRETQQKVKALFSRVNECLASAAMNPLYNLHTEITSINFDNKIREAIIKRLGVLIDRK